MSNTIPTFMFAALTAFLSAVANCQAAPDDREIAVRNLEEEERRAVLAGDVERLQSIWSPAMIVNNPQSTITPDREAILDLVRRGAIKYETFERAIEEVRFVGDVAIVMGWERVVPVPPNPKAGQEVKRRFTNIWRMQEGSWRIIARHANVIPE